VVSGSALEQEMTAGYQPKIVSDPPSVFSQGLNEQDWPGDLIGIPLQVGGSVLGFLWGYNEEAAALTLEDIALLVSIGERIGTAIENVRLNEDLRRMAVLEERHRLARDLHDSVTQEIYSLMLFAGDAKRHSKTGNLSQTEASIKRIEEIAHQSLKELRLLIYELRPLDLQQAGLVKALWNRLEAVEKRAGLQVRFTSSGEISALAGEEEHLYRIAVEVLNNSLKYSGATQVSIRVTALNDIIEMEIGDNGCGFDPEQVQSGGNGLRSMRERAAAIGGNLTIQSSPGQGTTVYFRKEGRHG